MSRSELIRFFLEDFGFFQVIAGSYCFSSALFGSAHFGRSIVPVVSHQFWFHVFKGHAVKYHGINNLSLNLWLLNFLMVDQGFSWDQTNTAKGSRVNLRMPLPLNSCALFVLVSYFQTTFWCDFSENQRKWQDYVHHQATWFVAINHSSRFSKPQACLYWTVEASMESLNQKDCNLRCWIFGGFVVPIQTPSRLGEFVTKMSRPVEIVKGQQAWLFFAC